MVFCCESVPDHPRIRGEHHGRLPAGFDDTGSSPHTRGAPRLTCGRVAARRIIPAYAGSTLGAICPSSTRTDHPRIRGEHRAGDDHSHDEGGSSPHTRGALNLRTNLKRKTNGSSPHTRGARLSGCSRRFSRRIIPAYAGSTRLRPGNIKSYWDHPRIRGEHTASLTTKPASPGSSPHTRGAPEECVPYHFLRSDHPRIRGEHSGVSWIVKNGTGSSPHTRGAPPNTGTSSSGRRIIPAYAGSTWTQQNRPRTPSDHPRIRGEHALRVGRDFQGVGSSPHTRGALLTHSALVYPFRIIPAYAGSTARGGV